MKCYHHHYYYNFELVFLFHWHFDELSSLSFLAHHFRFFFADQRSWRKTRKRRFNWDWFSTIYALDVFAKFISLPHSFLVCVDCYRSNEAFCSIYWWNSIKGVVVHEREEEFHFICLLAKCSSRNFCKRICWLRQRDGWLMMKVALSRFAQSCDKIYSRRLVLKDAVTGRWWDCAINFLSYSWSFVVNFARMDFDSKNEMMNFSCMFSEGSSRMIEVSNNNFLEHLTQGDQQYHH